MKSLLKQMKKKITCECASNIQCLHLNGCLSKNVVGACDSVQMIALKRVFFLCVKGASREREKKENMIIQWNHCFHQRRLGTMDNRLAFFYFIQNAYA